MTTKNTHKYLNQYTHANSRYVTEPQYCIECGMNVILNVLQNLASKAIFCAQLIFGSENPSFSSKQLNKIKSRTKLIFFFIWLQHKHINEIWNKNSYRKYSKVKSSFFLIFIMGNNNSFLSCLIIIKDICATLCGTDPELAKPGLVILTKCKVYFFAIPWYVKLT